MIDGSWMILIVIVVGSLPQEDSLVAWGGVLGLCVRHGAPLALFGLLLFSFSVGWIRFSLSSLFLILSAPFSPHFSTNLYGTYSHYQLFEG